MTGLLVLYIGLKTFDSMALFSDTMCLLSGPTSSGTVRASTQQNSPHAQSESPNRVYPLTKSQEGMWVEFQTDPSSTKYNLTLEWNLFQNRPVLAPLSNILTVIHKLTERHAVLRCMIATVDGKPYLQEYLANAVDPDVRIVHREQCAISEKAMKQIIRQPFSLSNELPARWIILQDIDVYRVYLVGHHIVVDGQSMTIISKEFLELLDNPDTKLPSPTAFSAMHMIEVSHFLPTLSVPAKLTQIYSQRAWASSSTYTEQQNVLLRQIRNQSTAPWPKRMQALRGNADGDGNDYRKIDTWSTFPKSVSIRASRHGS